MLQNYLKIALRNLWRHKGYAFINIFGLSLGLAVCLLIFLYLRVEVTHDDFHADADRIHRIVRVEQRTNGTTKYSSGTPTPVGPAMMAEVPGIEQVVRARRAAVHVVQGEQRLPMAVVLTDASFFDVFSFGIDQRAGTPVLQSPNEVVLSAATAAQLFPNNDPLYQTLTLEWGADTYSVTITGVTAPIPNNSSIQFDLVLSQEMQPGFAERATSWRANNVATYVKAAPGVTTALLNERLVPFTQQRFGQVIETYQENGWWAMGDDAFRLTAQPLADVHFDNTTLAMIARTSDPTYVYLLGGIGLLVLLIACINFMTLAMGRATSRIREVGLRKVLGAERAQLMLQFWGEAILLSAFALCLGIALAEFFLPIFNRLADTSLAFNYEGGLDMLLALGGLALVTGLVAGSYPALILSGFQPAHVLKGHLRFVSGASFTRAVVVFQFVVSIGMGICALMMFDQIDYMKSKDLGLADEEVVAVALHRTADPDGVLGRFRAAVAPLPDVAQVAGTSFGFNNDWQRTALIEDGVNLTVYMMRMEPEYLATMDMALVAGRNLSRDRETDATDAVLVNEAFVQAMDWDEPVGQYLPGFPDSARVEVVGVVRDYHFLSLHEAIHPVILHMDPQTARHRYAMVRISTAEVGTTLGRLEAAWKQVAPDEAFDYAFIDERLDQQYRAEERWNQIVSYAAGFAILIACMGLFGLATLAASRRTKEVGIRKVLGASAQRVVLHLSLDFVRLVMIAFVLAAPLAWWAMQQWLGAFAYQAPITPTPFLLAGATAFLVTVGTISIQALRIAYADPVDALRYE